MTTFEELLSRESIFLDKSVLSPHYIPDFLPYREDFVYEIMETLSPAFKGQKPSNIFLYGKTGTGKTCTAKFVLNKFNEYAEKNKLPARMVYMNCRVYNSRYRVMDKLMKYFYPDLNKTGFGLTFIYEKLLHLLNQGIHVVAVLDEIDMVKDLDDLIYTLTRANDEVKNGSITILGISNKLSFKNELDPRSKSSLYEKEIIFPPYTAPQIREILKQRVAKGFKEGSVSEAAINLIAAITAQETGDARYALKLLERAGEIAQKKRKTVVEEKEVEEARRQVDYDITAEAITTLPISQQLVLYALAKLTLAKPSLDPETAGYFFSGELYEEYVKVCRQYGRKPRSVRWYSEYINTLELLGLISTVFSGKGIKGRTRLIKLGCEAEDVIKIVEKNMGLA